MTRSSVFTSNRSQAVRLPKAVAFPEDVHQVDILKIARSRLISAATVLDTAIVLETRLGDADGREFDLWLLKVGAEVVPVDAEQIDAARRAWRYGKGRHAAGLNYGDCFSYALAVSRGEPLVFNGEDFAKTDINRKDEGTVG